MATTDEELAQLQKSVEKKREQLADAERQREERQAGLSNDITAAQLQAEEARLDAALSAAKADAKAANVKSGASGPLDAAKEEMRLAVERQKGQEALVTAQAEQEQAAKDADSDTKE